MEVLVRLVENATNNNLDAANNSSGDDNSTSTDSPPAVQYEIDFAGLIASNIPSLATINITGKCAFLADGSEVAMTTDGVTGYSQSNNQESEIAKIDTCTESGADGKSSTYLQNILFVFIVFFVNM